MRTLLLLAAAFVAGTSLAAEPAWQAVALPAEAQGKTLRAVAFADAEHGWIAGDAGLCLATADGGKTWAVQPTGSKANLRAVSFADARTGFACGDGDPDAPAPRGHIVMGRPMKSATLLETADGGKTWKAHWVPTNFDVTSVSARSATDVQLANSGGTSHLDGDNLRFNGKGFGSERIFRALFGVAVLDDTQRIGVGSPVCVGFMPTPTSPLYTDKRCRAIFSADGGKTWQPSKGSEGAGRMCLRAVAARAGGLAVAVGDQGGVLRSEDAGKSWTAVDAGTKANLHAAAWGPKEGQQVLATGDGGVVLASTDGGKTWTAEQAGKENLHGIALAGTAFIAVGEKGAAWRR